MRVELAAVHLRRQTCYGGQAGALPIKNEQPERSESVVKVRIRQGYGGQAARRGAHLRRQTCYGGQAGALPIKNEQPERSESVVKAARRGAGGPADKYWRDGRVV